MSKKADAKKDIATHSTKDQETRSENSRDDQKDTKPAKLPKGNPIQIPLSLTPCIPTAIRQHFIYLWYCRSL